MPSLKNMRKENGHKSAQAVNGNERAIQESGIDKFALGDGAVNYLQHPAHEAINRKKDDVIKETESIVPDNVLHNDPVV